MRWPKALRSRSQRFERRFSHPDQGGETASFPSTHRGGLAACRTHEIDGQILKQMESTSAFSATNSSLLAISILLFHLSAKSDRLLAVAMPPKAEVSYPAATQQEPTRCLRPLPLIIRPSPRGLRPSARRHWRCTSIAAARTSIAVFCKRQADAV